MSPFAINIDNIPPFGLINEDNEAFLRERPVPERFLASDSSPNKMKSSADDWDKWVDERAVEISNLFWPIYNDENQKWEGTARSKAMDLTFTDLTLMKKLQLKMNDYVWGKVDTDPKPKPTVKHLDLFRQEDEPVPPRVTFSAYNDQFPSSLSSVEWDRAVVLGGRSIARPASQALKKKLQRPRPMQTALMFGIKGLVVHRSVTAVSPAMIGGHCIQGMMALAELEESMASVFNEDPGLRDDVRRYFIDTGDRRVFAGLHHPSDNIGTWWVVFKLCERVFSSQDAPRIRGHLWSAITKHSAVYAAMIEHAANDSGSPYSALLAELEKVGGNSTPKN